MGDVKNGYQATPNATLEQQMMDACAPKNEREWWAFAEIGRLRAEVASLTAQLQSGESFHAVAVHQRDAAWGEVETLKATLTQQCKGFRADVEKLEAEVEALRADAERAQRLLRFLFDALEPLPNKIAYKTQFEVLAEYITEIDAARAAQGGE